MLLRDIADRVTGWMDHQGADEGGFATPLDGLMVLRHRSPHPIEAVVYHPLVCLILQGEKETLSGSHRVRFGPGESLVVSHDLPVLSRVTKASETTPYLALVLTLDLGMLRSLDAEVGDTLEKGASTHALEAGPSDPALVDAVGRFFSLVDRPREATVLAPLVRREIHFRLLLEGHSNTLRHLLQRGSYADRIARAIGRIKQDFATSLPVPELARDAGMSPSSFHTQFKALTATTPLQYQKDLRLIEARRLLINEGHTVSSAAFRVGYESPTQFSREYARKFGEPPRLAKASASVATPVV
ncbi:MAG: AraC family transcriptional regulator [Rhodothermales bacterium]